MANPYVRLIGIVTDLDGVPVKLGVDYDSVTIDGGSPIRLESARAEEFGRLFIAACWEAGANGRRMREEQA
jgi:hypothetical protein